MVELSQSVEAAIKKTFREPDRHAVAELLLHDMANNLPMMSGRTDPASFDRVRMAALKFSNGQMDALYKGIDLAKRDWRDLLVAAGFGQLDAHAMWYQSLLCSKADDR